MGIRGGRVRLSKILVIEDDEKIRHMMRQTLQGAGHSVVCAADGRQGLDLFQRQRADLVVTDIFMPVMDGLEVIHSLRKKLPTVRIVALRNTRESMETSLLLKILAKYHIECTMVKPIQPHDLLGCVAKALG